MDALRSLVANYDSDDDAVEAIDSFKELEEASTIVTDRGDIAASVVHVSTTVATKYIRPAEVETERERRIARYFPNTMEELRPRLDIIQKVADYIQLQHLNGFNLAENIEHNKNFGNPNIFFKVVEHFGIDETGSNYPTNLFDPHDYEGQDYEDSIKKQYSDMGIANLGASKRGLSEKIAEETRPKQEHSERSVEGELPPKRERVTRWDLCTHPIKK
jgi:HCNGP-like protein